MTLPKNRGPLAWALLFLIVKVALFSFATYYLKSQNITPHFCSWDCGYYESIANAGYTAELSGAQSNLAFFPAFPWLTHNLLGWTQLGFGLQGIALNLTLFFFGIYLLLLWSQDLGLGAFYFLPAALFTLDRYTLWSQVPYTESLFFVCTISYFMILRRAPLGKWSPALAAAIGGLSTGVRLVGVALIGGLGLARLKSYVKNPLRGLAHLALGLAGVIAFFCYLQLSRGDWAMNLKASAAWHRELSFKGVFSSVWFLISTFYFPTIVVFACALYGIFFSGGTLRFSLEEKISSLFLIFIPLASTAHTSLTRYMTMVLIAYPVWATLILRVRKQWWYVGWALILLLELYWQGALTIKFFKNEAFLWAA